MPIVDPNGSGRMPPDWRWAYDQYRKLRQLAQSVNEPVHSWRLEFPGKGRAILDRRWRMTYSWEGQMHQDVFLGTDGRSSGRAIEQIIPVYADLVRRKKASMQQSKNDPGSRGSNPMWDNEKNKKWRDRFYAEVAKVRDLHSQREFEQRHPNLLAYMGKRAGFLEMSIQDYWGKHPHSRFWPAPPQSKEQYEARQKEYERRVKQRDDAIAQQKEAGTYNPAYPPPI